MSLALLFSPQGSQAVGMGRDLADRSAAAREVFAEADATLGWRVSETCWEGPEARLNDTRQTQPCLLTTSIAALRALTESVAVAPAYVAGHSVGEYAALVAAGVLDLAAALRLVARRAALMAAADDAGGMAAVIGLSRDAVERVVASVSRPTELVVANDNAPGQVVIGGTAAGVEAASERARQLGVRRVIPLNVGGAFHTPLFAEAKAALEPVLAETRFATPTAPVVSNVDGEPHTEPGEWPSQLADHLVSPVRWRQSLLTLARLGADSLVEVGPGNVLAGLARRTLPGVPVRNVAVPADVETVRTPLEVH